MTLSIYMSDIHMQAYPRDYYNLFGWEISILEPSLLTMLVIATSFYMINNIIMHCLHSGTWSLFKLAYPGCSTIIAGRLLLPPYRSHQNNFEAYKTEFFSRSWFNFQKFMGQLSSLRALIWCTIVDMTTNRTHQNVTHLMGITVPVVSYWLMHIKKFAVP